VQELDKTVLLAKNMASGNLQISYSESRDRKFMTSNL